MKKVVNEEDIRKANNIERCKELIKTEHANWIGISNQEAIRELLNMLEEKDKEMEFQKDINKIEKDRHKKTEKSLKGQIIKQNKIIEKLEKEAQKYFEEIIKQDRAIDLMAECIDVELSSARLGIILNKNVQPLENYKEYIKQYFKSKAEKE